MNTNYLTSPLTTYDPALQARAAEIFDLMASRLGRSRVRAERGSYSILRRSRNEVTAKIIYLRGSANTNAAGRWSVPPYSYFY